MVEIHRKGRWEGSEYFHENDYVLASDYAALEATLSDEVAENVRLRSREVGDEVGNLLQEVADLKNELARIQAGPHFVQYVDRLNEIYRRRREGGDDAERFLAIDELCRKLANESDEFMAQRDEARAELARVKAESLRVVEVENYGNLYNWYMTPTGLGYPGKDRKNNNCIESAEGYYRLDECRPVRIERWEANDDNH